MRVYNEKYLYHHYVEYKLKRCTNKECCKQCRHVMFKGPMTKWPVQKLAQGTTQKLLQHNDATATRNHVLKPSAKREMFLNLECKEGLQ